MLWPIQFIKGACPGLKRLVQITSDSATNAEKRFKYEKEKRPKRIHVDWYGIKITCFQKFLLKCLGPAEN